MKKLFTSSISLFMLLFSVFAGSVKAEELSFGLPATWEYKSVSDVFSFSVNADTEAFNGKVIVIATAVNAQALEYELYSVDVNLQANEEKQITVDFGGELGLPVGNYIFSVRYEDANGKLCKGIPSYCNSKVLKAPAVINRIPITTTTTRPIVVRPNRAYNNTNVVVESSSAMNAISVYSMTGRLIQKQMVDNQTETELNVSSINPGVYLVVGHTEEGDGISLLIKL